MRSSVLTLLLLIPSLLAYGQSQSHSGDIEGRVLDPRGDAVRGARVLVEDPARGLTRDSSTDGDGFFRFAALPVGAYRLRVEADGFSTRSIEGIEVRIGQTVPLPVSLSLADVRTEVEVTAPAEPVDRARIQQANTISPVQIEELPINRRNYLDFMLLAPGVAETTFTVEDTNFRPIATPNSGFSLGGNNGRGNGFYIDGVENYLTTGGVRRSLTQAMVEEFQINRSNFTAEFGNASGGIVNVVSKSGTNLWHGDLFGFLRHRDLQARNYFDPGKSGFTRVQAGASAGGALKQDRTFLFVAFERQDRQETNLIPILTDRGVFSRIPAAQSELLDVLSTSGEFAALARDARAFLQPGNDPRTVRLFEENSGVFPFAEDATMAGARIDHNFSGRHRAFFRANTTWNAQDNSIFGALDAYNRGRRVSQFDGTAMVSDSLNLSPHWWMETRLMFNYNTFEIVPVDPNGPEITISGTGLFGRQIFVPYVGVERHYQAIQNFSRFAGRHQLKFGYDFNPARNSFRSDTFFAGRFGFGAGVPLAAALANAEGDTTLPDRLSAFLGASGRPELLAALNSPISALQAYSLGIPSFYQQGFGDPTYVNFMKRFHVYLQDAWHARDNLTLNLGVRYELEFHNPIVPADRDNVGPRFGFAWTPVQNTVVRGGYGLYYSQINSSVAGTADPLSGKYINQIFIPQNGVTGVVNPRSGGLLTPADVYQALLRQNVIGRRPILESDLAQFGLRAAPGYPLSVLFGVDPGLENPWAHQASFEIERGVGPYTISAAYNFNRAAHIARVLGKNVRYTGERLPDGRPMFTRIEPLLLQRNLIESSANSFYHAAVFQVRRRLSHGLTANAHYTLSKAIDESTDFNSDFSPNDQLNHRAERALSTFHQKHRLVINAVWESPFSQALAKGWVVSPIVIASSYRPFNVRTGVDLPRGGDGYANTKRPAHLGRNMGRGPDYFTLDLRVSRRFGWGAREQRQVEILGEAFNLLNRTNFRTVNSVVGDVPISALPNPIVANRMNPTAPLAYTSALNPRQFQLGLKLRF